MQKTRFKAPFISIAEVLRVNLRVKRALKSAGLLVVLFLALFAPLSFVHAQQGDVLTLREGSPQSYIVVEGDTLWDIAGVFLEEPWLWPEIWQINPQVENPDLIYPGDALELIYIDGAPRVIVQRGGNLRATNDTDLPIVRLSPRVRRESLLSPIPAISLESISSFLSNNRIISLGDLDTAPRVLASRSDTQFSREGDIIYAIGNWTPGLSNYEIVRPAEELSDPQTGKTIAIQARLIGKANLLENENGQGTLLIDSDIEEIRRGDYFVVGEATTLSS